MAYNCRPLLMIVVAISFLLTLANGQLTVDGVEVSSATVRGDFQCFRSAFSPYISCDGGQTPVAGGVIAVGVGQYVITLNSVGEDPITINSSPACAVFIILPIDNCFAFPEPSGLITADIVSTVNTDIEGQSVAVFSAGPFSLVNP